MEKKSFNWEDHLNNQGYLYFQGILLLFTLSLLAVKPYPFMLFLVASQISLLSRSYFKEGMKAQKEADKAIRIVHTIAEDTHKVIVIEYDEDDCTIANSEYHKDIRYQDPFCHVISHK